MPIRGTEGAERPFFSPDGQWLAFSAGGIVKKVPIAGGPPIDIVEAGWGAGSWSAEGRIIYTRAYNEGLSIVSAIGGSPKMLTAPDHSKGELGHWWPQIMPDNETVLFTVFSTPIEHSRLVALSLKTGKQKTILEGGVFGRYLSSGDLVFARGETVLAAPFDLRSLEVFRRSRGRPGTGRVLSTECFVAVRCFRQWLACFSAELRRIFGAETGCC